MSVFLQLAFLLSIILLAAKTAGYLSTRIGQLGAGMISRGEVGATTLITPPILRALFARKAVKGKEIHLEAGQVRASSEAAELEAS